jgi:replication factor A1
MAVKDLGARQGNVNITLEISEKGDVREFEKFGKKGKVCNAVGKDSTGKIKITLWNDDIDKVNTGDTVKIENGWVSEWQGELQLSTGKFGKIEVVAGKKHNEKSITDDEKEESEILSGEKSDKGEHILSEDEKVEEEVLDGLSDEPDIEEEITDDEESFEEEK